MNAIGIKTLKNTLTENENDVKGNLPIYKNDLNTSVAFHVLTNQIVVVDMKNHRLYRTQIEQLIVTEHKMKKNKFNSI